MNESFGNWPLLDRQRNTSLGKNGCRFSRCFAIIFGLVLFHTLIEWRMLGWFTIVLLPLAAWLIGGLFGELLTMLIQAVYWTVIGRIKLRINVILWLCTGVVITFAGIVATVRWEPYFYGCIIVSLGTMIIGRMLLRIWLYTLDAIPDPYVFQESTLKEFLSLHEQANEETNPETSADVSTPKSNDLN